MELEVLRTFELAVEDGDGVAYDARVVGALRDDGTWVGWVEFTSLADGEVLATGRETTQPNLADVSYWAGGLTSFYLEGALARALALRERAESLAEDAMRTPAWVTRPCAALPARGVPRLEVLAVGDGVVAAVMGTRLARAGAARAVSDSGLVVYEGARPAAPGVVHDFAVQFGSPASAATLANWLWSRLRGRAARLWIDGEETPLTHDAIHRRLVAAPTLPGRA